MKKILSLFLLFGLLTFLITEQKTFGATTIIVDEVNMTTLLVDEPLTTYEQTRDSSSGWSYIIPNDPFGYALKTKRIKTDVDKIMEVSVPRLLLTADEIPLGQYDTEIIDPFIYTVNLKLYHSIISTVPYQTITLKSTEGGNQLDFAYLTTPIEVSRNAYFELEIRISQLEFANKLHYQSVPFVDWNSVTSMKQAMDHLFYEMRGSFRYDIMHQKLINLGYGTTYTDKRTNTQKAYTNYKSVVKGERYTEVEIPNETITYDQLPGTTKSWFEGAKPSEMGQVDFEVVGNSVDVIVQLDQTYRLAYTMQSGTDMSMFTEEVESYYFTDLDGEKYILINVGENSIFDTEGKVKATFEPYTIWHLNSDEFHSIQRFRSYFYTQRLGNNAVYAYFYTDEFVIDHLLTISLSFEYRYHYLFWSGDWQRVDVALEDGQSQWINTFGWQETWAMMLSPVMPLPVALATFFHGSIMALARTSGFSNGDLFVYGVEEIQKITPTGAFKTQLEQAYSKAYQGQNLVSITEGTSVYQLFLGQFNESFTTGFEINQDFSIYDQQRGINVIEMTYIMQGQLYTVQGEEMEVDITLGSGTDDQLLFPWPEVNLNISFTAGLVVFVVTIFVGAIGHKGGLTKLKLNDIIRLAVLGLIFGGLAYFTFEYIFTNTITINMISIFLRL